jgi:putative spermidine/putrescine transport system permease protein
MSRLDGMGRALRYAVVAGIVVAVLLPLLPLLAWSVSSRWFFPALLPPELSLRAWQYVVSGTSRVGEALVTSAVVALSATFLCVLLGVPAGRALGLYRFRGKPFLEYLILAPLIVPGIAVVMGVHVFFIRLGLSDTIAGVVLVHLLPTLPYMIIVMRGVFANYSVEYEQQAQSLGASRRQILLHVTLPSVLPGIVTGGLFVFLISWSQYVLTLMVGGGRVLTLPLLLFSFATSGDMAVTAALSVVFVLPAVLILLATSRYLTGRSGALSGLGKV